MYIYVDNFSIINIDVEGTITIFNTVEITDLIDLLHSNKQSNVEGEAGDAVLIFDCTRNRCRRDTDQSNSFKCQ